MSIEKEQIAESFKKHFEHFGYKKTSVDQIARDLQISKKTIYQFFDSKEQIFYYIISRVARQYAGRMQKDLQTYPTQQEKIDALVRMIFAETRKWTREHDAFEFKYKYEMAEMAFSEAYADLMKDLLAEGMRTGEFRQGNVALTNTFIQGILSQSLRLLTSDQDLPLEGETIEAIERLIL